MKRKIDLNEYKDKKVNIILKNNELLTGKLIKLPLLPIWEVDGKRFARRQVKNIYYARY